MEIATLNALRRFDDLKLQKVPIFTSDRLYYDLYCLLPGQFQRVHSHTDQDKIYLVLEGEPTFEIDHRDPEMVEGEAGEISDHSGLGAIVTSRTIL
jgi:oxalate decarboxylase/phosphoglucose isomerase-like protein (cupin superfamily)